MQIKHIKTDVWGKDVWVLVCPYKELKKARIPKRLHKELISLMKAEDDGSHGINFGFTNGSCLIWLRRKSKSVLVHEIVHCAFHILNHVGIKLRDASEESYTYLIEYLYEELV